MMRRSMYKLSNRKKIFYNTTREIHCLCCHIDLQESWVLSAPKEKYRCLPCALYYHVLLEVPKSIKEAMMEDEELIITT